MISSASTGVGFGLEAGSSVVFVCDSGIGVSVLASVAKLVGSSKLKMGGIDVVRKFSNERDRVCGACAYSNLFERPEAVENGLGIVSVGVELVLRTGVGDWSGDESFLVTVLAALGVLVLA